MVPRTRRDCRHSGGWICRWCGSPDCRRRLSWSCSRRSTTSSIASTSTTTGTARTTPSGYRFAVCSTVRFTSAARSPSPPTSSISLTTGLPMRRLTIPSIILAAALLVPGAAHTQAPAPALTGAAKWADSAARVIDRASIAGNLAGMQGARTLLERALVAFPNDPLLLHYQGYELYLEANILEGMERGG